MSRTATAKSKPKLVVADRAPARSPSVVDSPTPPPSALTVVPFRLLVRAPENVRHIRPDEDIAPLADNIAAIGLLQSLIGYLAPNVQNLDRCWIVGGGRRLQALTLLLERGAINLDWPVPVLIRDRDEAIDLSLAENLEKRDMSPVDECRAFAALMDRGNTSPLELAKRFGFGERYVRQRLRLAELAPEILDAVAERKITLPAAEAYARSSDHHLQLDVFKAQQKTTWEAHTPDRISAAYQSLQETTASPLFKFVGADIYERDGGGYEDDLFTGGEDLSGYRKLSHGHLLLTKADEMVRFQSIRLEAEMREELPGFEGFAVPPNVRSGGYPWKAPAAPKGQVMVESDYQVDRTTLWKNAKKHKAPVTVIIGVDASGALEIVRAKLFVDKAFVDRVKPKRASPFATDVETPEQRAAREREVIVDRWQWRLAIPPFAGTALDGRAFWPTYSALPVESSRDPRHEGGKLVSVQIWVSDEDHDAARAAAEERYEADQAAKAARERAAAEAQLRREGLLALVPPPAVIAIDGVPYFRKAAGDWCSEPAEIDDADKLGLFAGLSDLLDVANPGETVEHWPTIEAYQAALVDGETADV